MLASTMHTCEYFDSAAGWTVIPGVSTIGQAAKALEAMAINGLLKRRSGHFHVLARELDENGKLIAMEEIQFFVEGDETG